MNSKILILLAVLFVNYACEGQENNNPTEYKIPIDKSNKGIALTDISTNISIIPLETSNSILVGGFQRYRVADSLLFLGDIQQRSIFIFDLNGNFINKIGSPGKGAGEILELSDFLFDEEKKRIIVWDNGNKKMLTFTLNGKVVNSKKTITASDFTMLGDDTFLLNNQSTRKNIINILENSKITGGYLKNEKKYENLALFRSSNFFYHQNNEVNFITRFTPIVYSLSDGILKEKYFFNFGKYTFNGDKFTKENIQSELDKSDYTSYYNSFSESRSHLYFSYKQNNKYYSCLVNKNTGESISTFGWTFLHSQLSKDRTNYHFNMLPVFDNDILLGMAYMSDIMSVLDVMSYEDKTKLYKLIPSLKQVFNNSKPSDNPVLIAIKLNNE